LLLNAFAFLLSVPPLFLWLLLKGRDMINGILFAIVFLWLLTLTLHHYQVFRDLENHQHQIDQDPKASPPAGEKSQDL